MTPLKPIENTTRVRGVASKRYPPNRVCAHPECSRTDVTQYHIFGRPPGEDSDSWFVALALVDEDRTEALSSPLPHVTGLCGHGTEGHHGDVESHRAWIKYEDGEFVWYELVKPDTSGVAGGAGNLSEPTWRRVGPLNPQPGSREGKSKRKRKKGAERRKRVNVTVKVPQDTEDGAGLWDDALDRIKTKLIREGLYDSTDEIPAYEAWMACANDWLNS